MRKIGLVDKAFLLKRTSLFKTVDLDLVLRASEKAAVVSYSANELIFHEGEEAHHIFFVASGEIELFREEGKHLNEPLSMGPLSYFGEEALFSGKPRGYSAQSLTDSFLVTFTKNKLFQILAECPEVALGFLESYGEEYPFPKMRRSKS